MDFNSAMAELEEINSWFETNELDLDESIIKYERAAELITFCKERLAFTQNKFIEINNKIAASDQNTQEKENINHLDS